MSPNPITELRPGDEIVLASECQLETFENLVADAVDPNMTPTQFERWLGRSMLEPLIRLTGVNGALGGITLRMLPNAFERLEAAATDENSTWKFTNKGGNPGSRTSNPVIQASFICFELTTDRVSTIKAEKDGLGSQVGHISTMLWYGLVPRASNLYCKKDGTHHLRRNTSPIVSQGGASVQRYVAVPRITDEQVQAVGNPVRRLGFVAIHDAFGVHEEPVWL